ncbi:MAG: S8 family serine peptidase [Chloroflexi bacterium]|nr:S8 family serine peptidase [Chloroflexota bacterium]
MFFFAIHRRTRLSIRLMALALGIISLLLFSLPYISASAASQIKFVGTVLTAPAQPNGIGTWTIQQTIQDGGVLYTVVTDANTQFDNGVPTVGKQVEVRGQLDQSGTVFAERIRPSDGNGQQERDFRGIVVVAPANQIGQWIFQNGQGVTQTITADAYTIFDHGIPVVGQWAETQSTPQQNGTLLAKRIRPDDFETRELVARLSTGVLSSTIASRYDLVPESTLLASGNIYLFTTPDSVEEDRTRQMAADPDVIWAELNFVGRIPTGNPARVFHWGGTDPSGYVNQNAFSQVDLAAGLARYQGQGSIVAVLDTGVDLTHPSLLGHLVSGRDMVADDDIPQDEGDGLGWGHGTHIAGVIAQIAPASQIMPVRVLDSNGRGNTFTLAYAVEWAVNHGANVINLSLGTDADSRVLHEAIDNALLHNVVVVAAAGNDNSNAKRYPVGYAGVIGVTAVDGANVKADFANYGATWVDIAAPGVGITSTIITAQGSGYASWSGTSMATSFVSGAAALARQKFPLANPLTITQVLRATARNIDVLNPAYVGQVGGILDIGAALAATPDVSSTPTPLATPTLSPTALPSFTPPPTPLPGVQQVGKLYLPFVKKQNR